jgi:hypothetical protein
MASTKPKSVHIKKVYWERKLAGLCVRCGSPIEDDTIFCRFHKLKNVADATRLRKKKLV